MKEGFFSRFRPTEAKEAKETKEKKEEQSTPLDSARRNYAQAQLDFESQEKKFGKPGSEEARKAFSQSDSALYNKLLQGMNHAEDAYRDERRGDLKIKLEAAEKELAEKGISEKDRAAELEKMASAQLVSEFKKTYDEKTKLIAEAKAAEKPWILSKIRQVTEDYKKLSFKKKMIYSGALMAGGVAAGAIGGGAGLALATLIGGGRIGQRLLSSGAAFMGLEAVLKKQQEREVDKKAQAEFSRIVEENFQEEKAVRAESLNTAKGLISFLQNQDVVLEAKARFVSGDLKKTEQRLAVRRYLLAGTVGFLMASGLTAKAVGDAAHAVGLSPEQFFAQPKPEPEVLRTAFIGHEAGPANQMEAVVKAASQEAKFVATIDKGEDASQAAYSLVKEGKITKEDFREAWKHSTVEIRGVKVPISEVELVHSGDQVVYAPGAGGAPGHFEIIDYPKDRFSLGTGEDLYKIYEKIGKEPPEWLEKQRVAGIFDDLLEKSDLSAQDAKDIEFYFEHTNLDRQDKILGMLEAKMNVYGPDTAFSGLHEQLVLSPSYAESQRFYSDIIDFTGIGKEGYQEIKKTTVREFLEKQNQPLFMGFFFESNAPVITAPEDGKVFMGERKLAAILKKLALTPADKSKTVDAFLKTFSAGKAGTAESFLKSILSNNNL